MRYCLLAIGGDCSAGGMGDTSDYIPLEKSDMYLVAQYLRNQLERDILFASAGDDLGIYKTDKCQQLVDEHHALGNALIATGVFHHKWHKRTHWKLCAIELDTADFTNVSECPRKPHGYDSHGNLQS